MGWGGTVWGWPAKKKRVGFLDGFGTEPNIWSCRKAWTAGALPRPIPNTTVGVHSSNQNNPVLKVAFGCCAWWGGVLMMCCLPSNTLWLSECRDTLQGWNHVSLEMHLETLIKRVWGYTCRPHRSELRDALPGCDCASLAMQLEAMFIRVWRWSWRLWSSDFGDAP
jgi:hypothetical protein